MLDAVYDMDDQDVHLQKDVEMLRCVHIQHGGCNAAELKVRVCTNFRVWFLRDLYWLYTTTMNSGHDLSSYAKNLRCFQNIYTYTHIHTTHLLNIAFFLTKSREFFVCRKKASLSWGVPPSGLGAVCLPAVVLAHHDLARSPTSIAPNGQSSCHKVLLEQNTISPKLWVQ